MIIPLLLIGCSSRPKSVKIQLNSFQALNHSFPKPTQENTIAILVGSSMDNEIMEDEIRLKLECLLQNMNYRVVAKHRAKYLLFCYFDKDSKKYEGIKAIYEPGKYSTTEIYDMYGYRATAETRLPGKTHYVPYTDIIFSQFLDLELYNNEYIQKGLPLTDSKIWICKATSYVETSDLRKILPYLLYGSMEYFSNSTEERKYTYVKYDSVSVAELRDCAYSKREYIVNLVKRNMQLTKLMEKENIITESSSQEIVNAEFIKFLIEDPESRELADELYDMLLEGNNSKPNKIEPTGSLADEKTVGHD